MENESTIQLIDNSENQSQDNISNIKNFLQDLPDEKKELIEKTLKNSHDLTNDFDLYLKDISKVKEIKLKNKLKECNNTEEVQKIIEIFLSEQSGYQIGYHEINNNTLILEHTNEDNQDAKINNHQANIDNHQANIDNRPIVESVPGLVQLNDAISARQVLVNDPNLPDLDERTNEKSDLFQATKSEFEKNGIIQQLKDSNHDETFINKYILVHTTLKELKQNKNYKDVNISFFEKAVKNLDNACNIPDTKIDSFNTKNLTQTRTELFTDGIGNESLIKAKESNKSSKKHEDTYKQIFALNENEDTDEQLIKNYGKFIEDSTLNDLITKYNENGLSEQECDTLRKGLESTKENIDNQAKDLIEEMCLIAPIQGIFACIGPDLGNNFKLNKSREISNENGEVTITGHIDGIQFSLHHDTTDSETHLQTSSTLTKIDNNKFEIGKKFEDSPYKLPTNGDIFTIATSCITDGDVTSAKNATEYFQLLQEKISNKFETVLYKKAEYANDYIKDKIKGEKVSNQYLSLLGQIKGNQVNGNIEESNSKLYNFIDLMNSSNYLSSSTEKENISNCIDTIKSIVSTYGKTDKQTNKYPGLICHFLMDKKILQNTQKILKGFDVPGESILDLFGYYTEQNSGIKTINFRQLQKDLEGKVGQESLIASMRQDNENKKNADIDLENAIDNMV